MPRSEYLRVLLASEKPVFMVSACLCGQAVRYDGGKYLSQPVRALVDSGRALPFCPECAAGLPVPRRPMERVGRRVLDNRGEDYTRLFKNSAQMALEFCRANGLSAAILKENSPSCGVHWIYDGSFSGRKIPGMGVAAQYLFRHGVAVFSEFEIEQVEM